MERLQPRWEAATKTIKDIYEKTLRNFLPSLSNAEMKKSLKDHEGNMMIRFHTCLILFKDIEHVVNDATNMWKNIYHLHKPSEDTVEITDNDKSDDNDDDDDGDDIEDIPEDLQSLMLEIEEETEREMEEEVASTGEIVSSIASSIDQSPPVPSQLQVSTIQVPRNSSIELAVTSSVIELPSTSSAIKSSTVVVISLSVSLPPTACTVSLPSFISILSSSTTLAPIFSPVSSPIVNILVCTSFLGSISSFDIASTSLSLPLVGPIPVLTASPAASTIVSTSKGKEVSTVDKPKTPLRLLLIDSDIDLDKEIVIPQINLESATVNELRLASQHLEQKAQQM